jgi:hypothetical protein
MKISTIIAISAGVLGLGVVAFAVFRKPKENTGDLVMLDLPTIEDIEAKKELVSDNSLRDALSALAYSIGVNLSDSQSVSLFSVNIKNILDSPTSLSDKYMMVQNTYNKGGITKEQGETLIKFVKDYNNNGTAAQQKITDLQLTLVN